MSTLATPEHQQRARDVRESLAAWRDGRDLVEIGAYQAGTNPKLDRAVARMPVIETFLRQSTDELNAFDETVELLGLVTGAQQAGGVA